jgi:hypothetical protein
MIIKHENDLESTLKELNEKESNIYEIQKNKLQMFRYEIKKYEDVYKDLEDKYKEMASIIDATKSEEQYMYNTTYMIYEDYLSYNNELTLNKKKLVDLKSTLREIEKSYPKDFQFLLEDVQFEKDLNEIAIYRSNSLLFRKV